MTVIEWARSVKPDLVKLQQEKGIPAMWAAAQMCHESAVNGGQALSDLACKANNYAGLKWAEWQRGYGCGPVTYGTWEVLNGQRVDLADAFCKCPDFATWLRVYGDLLTGSYYGGALTYAADPLLFGWHIWRKGWATDPNYMVGVSSWMAAIYADYQDTLPGIVSATVAAARQPIPILDEVGRQVTEGWLEGDRTVAKVRDIVEAVGWGLEWNPAGPRITLRRPGV